MKSGLLFLCNLYFLFACTDVKLESREQQGIAIENQQWRLVRMTGNFLNSETTAQDMAWQETYVLTDTGAFTKVRAVDGETLQTTGTYQIVELSDGLYVEFTYLENSELIGNCTGDLKEFLSFRDGALFGTWLACDGPGLEYQKVND